jgi:pantoate--beta-alanine ligase
MRGESDRSDAPGGEKRGMRTIRRVAELRAALGPAHRAGMPIGLVPTMGAFHEGHLSLMARAREQCEVVVVSLFVNPAQFEEEADLSAYPRDEATDARMAAELGVDYLFAPPPAEIYPEGFATTVVVRGVTESLEGAHRGRGHFDGVATVVTKLLNIVAPDVAYFGRKDAQQAVVIRRLVRDLEIPVRIEVCPTIREPDGLAMSSRNVRLSPQERQRALALRRALQAAARAVRGGASDPAEVRRSALAQLACAGIEPEYFELVDPETLAPVQHLEETALALLAARVGGTRLIDNELLPAPGGASDSQRPQAPTTVPRQEVQPCSARC